MPPSATPSQPPPPDRPLRAILLPPLLVALALSLPKLGQGGWSSDLPWYTAIAHSAYHRALSGDLSALWSLPGIDSLPYLNKPPLAFWLNGIPIAILGPSVLAARLGSVIAFLLCVLLTSLLARSAALFSFPNLSSTTHTPSRQLADSLALSAGLCTALWYELARHARAFSLDLWLCVFLLWALLSFTRALTSTSPRKLLLIGLPLGLALLTKPLLALLIYPFLALILLLDLRNSSSPAPPSSPPRHTWFLWLFLSLLLSLSIAAPWHISMYLIHSDSFLAQYFSREIANRALGSGTTFNSAASNPFYYLLILLKTGWPFLLTTLLAIIALFIPSTPPAARRWIRLGTLWLLFWLVALSFFADKRPRYALPLYPIAAWLSSIWIVLLSPPSIQAFWNIFTRWIVQVVLLVALALSLSSITVHRPDSPAWEALFAQLHTLDSPPTRIYSGGLSGERAARIYLHSGQWPIAAFSTLGTPLNLPHHNALILYHRRDALQPGPNEQILWSQGDLTLTRLLANTWQPLRSTDPGESAPRD